MQDPANAIEIKKEIDRGVEVPLSDKIYVSKFSYIYVLTTTKLTYLYILIVLYRLTTLWAEWNRRIIGLSH